MRISDWSSDVCSSDLIVTEQTRQAMRDALVAIQTGEYAKKFILENAAGAPTLTSRRRINAESQTEQVAGKLRAMMPWIDANKRVEKSKNSSEEGHVGKVRDSTCRSSWRLYHLKKKKTH